MLRRFRRQRRERREREARQRVLRVADSLVAFIGNHAYAEACGQARACRSRQDAAGGRLWRRVAIEVAARTRL
jgi:hypothetical protein